MSPALCGTAAALWLGALWYAAPLLRPAEDDDDARYDAAAHVRDAIVIGVGIPFGLAAYGFLTPLACWILIALVVIARTRTRPPWRKRIVRSGPRRRASSPADVVGIALPYAAVAATVWPEVVRPLLNGDSLAYHLPNAAAWSNEHTLWTTATWSWWFPGGSELFAAGLFSVAGPLAVGFGGFVALLLLALRLSTFARRAGFTQLASGAFAAAVGSIGTIAAQGASLENDVWLAAWLLEIVWAEFEDRPAASRAIAITVLLKPYGFVLAAFAAVLSRTRVRHIALAFTPLLFWIARDAILWRSAWIAPAALNVPHLFDTTIVAQGLRGLTTLLSALVHAGPGMILVACALAVTLYASPDPIVRTTAFVALAIFLVEPFGFRNDRPQVAPGTSLRYALPCLALGVVGALPFLKRYQTAVAIGCVAVAAYQVAVWVRVFDNDTTTRGWFVVAAGVALAVALDAVRTRGVLTGLLGLSLVAYAVVLAGSHPADYYDDGLRRGAVRSHLYAWLARERPARLVGDHALLGSILVVSPQTDARNTVDGHACRDARRAHALLVIADDPPSTQAERTARRAEGRACGAVRYDDGIGLVIAPL